ncbi:hypothetical protein BH09PSE2_BH09PSE2_13120 [soil metagenome]
MSDNRIEGAGDKFAGSVKEGLGKVTGNERLEAEGVAQKTGGSIQNAAGKVEDALHPKSFNEHRADGAGHKLMGSIKEGVGKLTGNEKLEAEGVAEKTGGSIQNAFGKAGEAVKGAFDKK